MWLQMEPGPLYHISVPTSEQPSHTTLSSLSFLFPTSTALHSKCLTCYHHRERHPKAVYDMTTEGFTSLHMEISSQWQFSNRTLLLSSYTICQLIITFPFGVVEERNHCQDHASNKEHLFLFITLHTTQESVVITP